MEIKASVKYVRNSPRKVRLVVDAIKKFSPQAALDLLTTMPQAAAEPVRKLILSAVANAKVKNVDPKTLKIKFLEVTEGPIMKRWRAVARGTGHGYKKRMSHINIVLSDELKEK